MYPSAELLLIGWLGGRFPGVWVGTTTPDDLQDQAPVVTVRRIGGSDDVLTLDRADMDVDVYAASWAEADELSRQIRVAIRMDLPGWTITTDSGTAVVARADTLLAPSARPVRDPGLSRSGGSYRLIIHSH